MTIGYLMKKAMEELIVMEQFLVQKNIEKTLIKKHLLLNSSSI